MLYRTVMDSSFRVFRAYPKLILPIFFAWVMFFFILVASLFFVRWDITNIHDIFYIFFSYYLIFALLISIACSMLLEMIEQIENGEGPSFFRSLKVTIWENLNDMIPIIFVWALLWAGITFLEVLFSKARNKAMRRNLQRYDYRATSEEFDDVNKAIEFFNGNFSFSFETVFFEILKRGLRMTVMMSFCAIAWDNLGYYDAIKKAFRVIQTEFSDFASSFLTTGIVLMFIFFPPVAALFYWSSGYGEIHSRNVIFLVIYVLCALSYAIYMEQIFISQFYMWYRKWEYVARKSLESGRQPPEIEDIPVPSILDKYNDLAKNGKNNISLR